MEATEEQIASTIARLADDDWTGESNRDRVAFQLAAVGPKAIPQILQALKSHSSTVRAGAAQAIGKIPSEQTVGILQSALRDPEAEVRKSAARGLGRNVSREAALALAHAWETEQDEEVRGAIVDAFENLHTPETERILLNAMNDGDFDSAWPAAMILAGWGHPQAPIGMLGIAMRVTKIDWASNPIYRMMIYVLSKGDRSVVPNYIEALSNSSEDIRAIVAAALGYIGDPTAVPALLRLMDGPETMVRNEAIFSLGRIATPEALAALLPLLDDTKETGNVLQAVHNVVAPDIIAACAKYLGHPKRLISNFAAVALTTQGPTGMAALIAGIQSPHINRRLSATYALSKSKDRIVTESLLRALKDENLYVRRNAAIALESIADPRAADALLHALDDPELRLSAVGALGKIGERRAVPKICALLASNDSEERQSAVLALWDIADPDSYDDLLIACKNEYHYVQGQAAMALGWLNLPEAADYLVSMLRHEQSFEARSGAAYALGALGLQWTRDELIRAWWEDEDINVFFAAHAALERFGSRELCSPENKLAPMLVEYGDLLLPLPGSSDGT